jgi:hypothetical protein
MAAVRADADGVWSNHRPAYDGPPVTMLADTSSQAPKNLYDAEHPYGWAARRSPMKRQHERWRDGIGPQVAPYTVGVCTIGIQMYFKGQAP